MKFATPFALLFIVWGLFWPQPVAADGPPNRQIYLPQLHFSAYPPLDSSSLLLHATNSSIGLVVGFPAVNPAAIPTVYYRAAGSKDWLAGHPLAKDPAAGQWRGSLVQLNPDRAYEVQVRFDAAGVRVGMMAGVSQTQPDYPAAGTPRRLLNAGPDNLAAVINGAGPGDTVRLAGGVYYTSLLLGPERSGAPGAYLTIEPVPGAQVIFDGSDPAVNGPGDNWQFYAATPQGGIYFIDLPWADRHCNDPAPGYVGELIGGQSVRYLLFDDLRGDWSQHFLAAPPGKAFYVCNGAGPGPQGRLYVVTYAGDDPDNHEMQLARYQVGLQLHAADYVRVRGLEFRYYSEDGILLDNLKPHQTAEHNIIEQNRFHAIGKSHLKFEGAEDGFGPSDTLVQNNQFYEHGFREQRWSWELYYNNGRDAVAGIRLNDAGPGNVIRNNTVTGGHDGIDLRGRTHEVDIVNNTVTECMDDGMEIDNSPGWNIRVWNNVINYCYTGFSFQDWNGVQQGPLYLFRNVINGGEDPQGRSDWAGDNRGYAMYTAFKVGSDREPNALIYLYHNTISIVRVDKGNGIQNSGGPYFSGVTTRNNIWRVGGRAINFEHPTAVANHDFDCDNLPDNDPGDDRFIQWTLQGGPYGNGRYASLAQFQAGLQQEKRGMSTTKTLFDAALRLKSGSPEIDQGCLIPGFNDRGPDAYSGAGPDLGAFEFRP